MRPGRHTAEGRVSGAVHGGHDMWRSVTAASRFLIGLVVCFRHARRLSCRKARRAAPVGSSELTEVTVLVVRREPIAWLRNQRRFG